MAARLTTRLTASIPPNPRNSPDPEIPHIPTRRHLTFVPSEKLVQGAASYNGWAASPCSPARRSRAGTSTSTSRSPSS